MCTLHDFLSSKARFIHTSTVTGSHSCSGKNTRTPRVHLVVYMVSNELVYVMNFAIQTMFKNVGIKIFGNYDAVLDKNI